MMSFIKPAEDLSPTSPNGIDICRFGEISAELRFGGRAARLGILASHELTEDEWHAVSKHWNLAIAEESARGGHELVLAYSRAFTQTADVLTTVGRVPAPTEPSEGVPTPPPAVQLATFQLAKPETPSAIAVSPSPAPAGAAAADSAALDLGGTTDTDLRRLVAPVLPFGSSGVASQFSGNEGHMAPPAPVPAVHAASPALSQSTALRGNQPDPREKEDLTGTSGVDPARIRRAVLPFSSASPVANRVPPPTPPAEPRKENLTGTVGVDPSRAERPTLPFAAYQRPRRAVEAPPELAETTTASLAAFTKNVLPFAEQAPLTAPSASRDPGPSLDLEAYASLSAELARFPQSKEATLRKYGIPDEAALTRLQATWGERLQADRALSGRFQLIHAQRLVDVMLRPR